MTTETQLTCGLRRLLIKQARLEAEMKQWSEQSEKSDYFWPGMMADLAGRIAATKKKIALYARDTVLID